MDSDDAIIRESGERLAISMTVSALLAELPGDGRIEVLHQLLSDILEAQLAQIPEDGTSGAEAAREMFAHATAAVDRIVAMAKKLKDRNDAPPSWR